MVSKKHYCYRTCNSDCRNADKPSMQGIEKNVNS